MKNLCLHGCSYKMSIRFEDFYKKGDGGFHYPFAPYEDECLNGFKTWIMKKILYPDTKFSDYMNVCFTNGQLTIIHL